MSKINPRFARVFAVVFVASAISPAMAATVWDGPAFNYVQPAADPTQAANQDRITSDVWITRGSSQGIFNAFDETSYAHNVSPAGTEWAYGDLPDFASLNYQDWEDWTGNNPLLTVGKDAVLHLISDDIYLSIRFNSFGGLGGGFSYTRSTIAPVPEPSGVLLGSTAIAIFFLAKRKRRIVQAS
jgi:hypothetical protein